MNRKHGKTIAKTLGVVAILVVTLLVALQNDSWELLRYAGEHNETAVAPATSSEQDAFMELYSARGVFRSTVNGVETGTNSSRKK